MSQAMLPLPHALEAHHAVGFGEDALALERYWLEVEQHYKLPASRQPLSIEQEFQTLVEKWRHGTQFTSSVTDMVMHEAYLRIIGMGEKAVPLLLRELEQRLDHWFVALSAITGVNPVLPEQRGRVKDMAAAWIRWGREEGYTW